MTPDEIMSPEQQEREKNMDPRVIELIDRNLREGASTAEAHARKQSENPYWPIGLCVAWMLGPANSEAERLYARHRLATDIRPIDGWGDARTTLLDALAGGRIEAWGVRPKDGQRVLIPRQEWIDLRIQQRGPWDEVRGGDGAIAYRVVRISAATMRREWPAETAAMKGAHERQEDESACLEALKEIMTSNPSHPIAKEKLREEWRPRFANVSDRMFDRLFSQAAREAGAPAWSAPGRRRAE